ncbi:MAG TPA: family 1 glycosylhydrolase [Patescibacteria group bacterium]|jgi:beta-glucosidase|nr:family 1 glycosylhydrolase [Patescibacteria group bacterium]
MQTPQETKINLPKDFLFGAASAAHQVEGNNTNSDWWEYEQMGRLPRSGKAADHYNRFEEDFKIAKSVGLTAMRISLEWSRIEPEEGKWAVSEIEHYKKVLRKLKELGLKRMVTLHHYTLPQWVMDRGGFETKQGVEAFARFSWFIAQNLGAEIDFWITINEPELYALMAYQRGIFPPFKKNNLSAFKVLKNLIRAHKSSYKAIKEARPEALISIAKNSAFYEPYRKDNFLDRVVAFISNKLGNHYFLDKIKHQMDFIGLNYYFYRSLKFDFKTGYQVMNSQELPKSDMGWQTYPEGIYYLLKDYKKYKKPIYITENGIANAADDMRSDFIRQHLYWIGKAMDFGIEVKGYFYWSLTDTFEWENGFDPKFGLVEVNFETMERKIRKSAYTFEELRKVREKEKA